MATINTDRVARNFYAHFKAERAIFLSSIQGNLIQAECETYASLILTRLVFLYFLQHKGLLDGDTRYLFNHLHIIQERQEEGSSYHQFLLLLFRSSLPTREFSTSSDLFGTIPYLDPSLFDIPLSEQDAQMIHIPDEAFARLFAFFDTYQWHLDDHLLQQSNDVTPDILGYILEQHINQQQTGAYYTKEDVTIYIASNTIIPALFDTVERVRPDAFAPDAFIWRQLREHPDRYIYDAVSNEHCLPTETTHEYNSRRARYTALRVDITAGNIHSIDDLITHNLDLWRFARDVIMTCEQPELLQGFYSSLQQITVLDPTCGSGAFLLAALKVLEPLYEACLGRMEEIARRLVPCREGSALHFVTKGVLKCSADPCARHDISILKSILTNNLYGVDLMEEAIEICKLRLLLKLVARVERIEDIEPLPNIHEHICMGNILYGYKKHERGNETVPEQWHTNKVADRWHVKFGEVMKRGGFAVIIGNPPYVEYNDKTFLYTVQGYETLACANLYPFVIESSYSLLAPHGRQGMILPLAAFATKNMIPLIEGLQRWFPCTWVSFYHFRPSMLFSGGKVASIPTTIYLAKASGQEARYSTCVHKWAAESRDVLFSSLVYCKVTAPKDPANPHYYAKFGLPLENSIMEKVLQQTVLSTYLAREANPNSIWYRSAGGLYWKVFINFAWPYSATSNKRCSFQEEYDRAVFVALLNSSLFWWYYTVTFDTFNLKDYMLFGFRFTYPEDSELVRSLQLLCQQLMNDFRRNARHLKRGQANCYTIYAKKSKPIIDEIDRVLGQHYGFTTEELHFILNYDLKHRLGHESEA